MKNVLFTLLMVSMVMLVNAQAFKNKDLQSLVDAEIAFANLAKISTNREAFLANVNAASLTLAEEIQSTRTHWTNEKPDSMWLNWYPAFADIANSGDLGYTYGPWDGHPDKKTPAQFGGHYITLWTKQADGPWKIAIDAGVVHDEKSKIGGTPIKTTAIKSKPITKPTDATKELLDADQELSASLKSDVASAYQQVASSEIKFFRNNVAPFSSTSDLEKIGVPGTIKELKAHVSKGGDLGYTYGLTYSNAAPGAKAAHRTFLRIWKKEDGQTWKLVLDAVL